MCNLYKIRVKDLQADMCNLHKIRVKDLQADTCNLYTKTHTVTMHRSQTELKNPIVLKENKLQRSPPKLRSRHGTATHPW
jgi:hypothetical protein